jgi:hypothetical protein
MKKMFCFVLVVLLYATLFATDYTLSLSDTLTANITNSGVVGLMNGSNYGNCTCASAIIVDVGWEYNWYDSQFYEFRTIMSFEPLPIPDGYTISNAMLYMYCYRYHDNTGSNIWPMFYNTPYPVRCDHISFGPTLINSAFWCDPLEENIGTLQESAFVGWVGLDVTSSYANDVQMVREFSQYRFYLPWGPDCTTDYNNIEYLTQRWNFDPSNGQKLIVTYESNVANQDNIIEPEMAIHIYPQPANTWILIKVPKSLGYDFDVDLYNIKGQLIAKIPGIKYSQEGSRIDLPYLDSGVYIIRVRNGEYDAFNKITIIK